MAREEVCLSQNDKALIPVETLLLLDHLDATMNKQHQGSIHLPEGYGPVNIALQKPALDLRHL